ncbi:phenylalanine--tRNA ligase subunit beta [Desulfuribacillus stibiiarsenatis]|uniref:Phenylalanine--tRNA ligase beta subunit n=1 Tax=Desulfuribacillus stibiiarsenatis TaxID=1390249 RepID=A0A1E5L2X6_9FIRM|nr:phenylalanine--tRNA ligase subunit beta [Desulfuribacillus stibiiarsenatis]OEH84434.1 phenylalanine--tRNA ligase subunit beta [Desulfuribacillus stibiiarsenatis]
MKVSYKWLNEWIDLSDITPEILADRLTNAGIEVDAIERLDKGVSNVVVGHVLEVVQHPDADKLRVCTVDVGETETLQIVCGAANVAPGQLVPVAKVGAVLPGDFKIKRSKLRGVESQGMICSGKELGLENKYIPKELQEGIYVFPEQYAVGTDVKTIFNLDDVVLELDLTPNRSDCLSIRGVAYEMGALFSRPVNVPAISLVESDNSIDGLMKLDVQDQELCPRYACRVIEDVKIAPSPMWLRNKLQAAGIRSINNIVDITNLILIEYGQPLHAFDYDKVIGKTIIVRRANEGEIIKTLDETERTLQSNMVVIADQQEAVAIAGVMGGFTSEVSDSTVNILLESAHFNPNSIRKTATSIGLRTEASVRFEKGTDPNIVIDAMNRAAMLIAELGGGRVAKGHIDSNADVSEGKEIIITADRINRRLGTDIAQADMVQYFERLHFTVTNRGEELLVKVPTRRRDITIADDLSEEVARLFGYKNIPTTLPIGQSTQGKLTIEQKGRRRVRETLLSASWDEAVSYSFINPVKVTELELLDEKYQQMIPLKMPMSEERSHLRTTMLPSMLELAAYNYSHKNDAVRLFELGKIFMPKELPLQQLPTEKVIIAGIAYGDATPNHWSHKPQAIDYYYVKGVVEFLVSQFGISLFDVTFQATDLPAMHAGQTASIQIGGKELGYIGQIHPKVQAQYDLPKTFYFELDYELMLELSSLKIQYQSLPRYPSIKRDLAIVVDKDKASFEIMKSVKQYAGALLVDLQLFDVYDGKGVGEGKKSLAFSLTFRNPEKTLTDEEIQQVTQKIISGVQQDWNAELRS